MQKIEIGVGWFGAVSGGVGVWDWNAYGKYGFERPHKEAESGAFWRRKVGRVEHNADCTAESSVDDS